jgi:hypothetical protein
MHRVIPRQGTFSGIGCGLGGGKDSTASTARLYAVYSSPDRDEIDTDDPEKIQTPRTVDSQPPNKTFFAI